MTADRLGLLVTGRGAEGPPTERDRRALAAVQLARLLAGLGTGPSAGQVDLDLARATAELDERLAAEALERCAALFGAHLDRGRGPRELVPWPGPSADDERAGWGGLVGLAERAPDLPLPSLPVPAEEPGAVARRILAAALCLGLEPARGELWRALLEHDEGAREAAEARLVALTEDAEVDHGTRVAATTALLGALLERGAVARAGDLARARLDLAAAAPELQRRAAWACLLAGETELAAELGLPTPARLLPPVLVALGQRRPELRADLTAGASWDPDDGAGLVRTFARGRRAEVGASLLAVFRLDGGAAAAVHLDAAPGLERDARRDDWLAERCLAPWDACELEQAVLATGRARVAFPDVATPTGRRLARACLTPACAALALVPIPGPTGATLGWLRLELEHRLLPTDADLTALAAALGRRLGLGRRRPPAEASAPRPRPEALAALVEPQLGSLARRRWWLVDADDRVLAGGGEALADRARGEAGLLVEARAAGAARSLGRREPGGATFHDGARAALVLPLGPGWSPATPWLLVEGTRTGDLGSRVLERWVADLAPVVPEVLLEGFRAWHARHHGARVHLDATPLDPPGPGARPAASLGTGELLARLTAGPGTWLISGPPGSGRSLAALLAAYVAWGPDGAEDLTMRSARGLAPDALAAWLDGPGPLLLEDVEHLAGDPRREALLLEALAVEGRRPLLLQAEGLAEDLGLWRRLADTLAGRELHLAPMVERRRELVGVLACLLRRAALQARTLPPVLTPQVEPLVWRLGLDLDGLAELARRLVDLRPGGELEPGDLHLVLEPSERPRRRLPSKSPDPRALWAALDGTRKAVGSFHRRRAAALLGWDPDTVSARIRDLVWDSLG